jgi:RNA polymerase sigma-70 factor, ECF subfamily
MDASSNQITINLYAKKYITHKAHQLVGTAGFTATDTEDIESELTLEVLICLPQFDPSKAQLNTFVARVVDTKVCRLIRHRVTRMRDHRREQCSLNAHIVNGCGETVQRMETISQEEHERLSGRHHESAEQVDQLIDLDAAMAQLPEELQTLCARLKTESLADISRKTGIRARLSAVT